MEVAGLALAIFPIVVNGITNFAEAVGTVRLLRYYSHELTRYARNIEGEEEWFSETLIQLLDGVVSTDDELWELIADPGGHLWRKAEYERRLSERLGSSYDIYFRKVKAMLNDLEQLKHKLGLFASRKESTSKRDRLLHEVRRFQIAFNKTSYEELSRRIRETNQYLRETTHQSIILEPRRKRLATPKHKRLKRLKHHARDIHQCLTSDCYWKCPCREKHAVSLRLACSDWEGLELQTWRVEFHRDHNGDLAWGSQSLGHILKIQPIEAVDHVRPEEEVSTEGPIHLKTHSALSDPSSFNGGVKRQKRVTFVAMASQQTTMTLTATTPAKEPSTPVAGLCTKLGLPAPYSDFLGFMQTANDAPRYDVYRDQHAADRSESRIQLDQLLRQHSLSRDPATIVFSRRDRLKTAVTLAWSALVLEGSWLHRNWTSKDVLLIHSHSSTKDTKSSTKELAFPWLLNMDEAHLTTINKLVHKMQSLRIKNVVLFALALSLIELSLGSTMQDLRSADENADGELHGNLAATVRLLPLVYEESGTVYGDAVQRALDCPFDVREYSLENETFLDLVFENIVEPLMNDLQKF